MSAAMPAAEVFLLLSNLFVAFDKLTDRFGARACCCTLPACSNWSDPRIIGGTWLVCEMFQNAALKTHVTASNMSPKWLPSVRFAGAKCWLGCDAWQAMHKA